LQHVDTEPCTRLQRLPDEHRLGLALRLDRPRLGVVDDMTGGAIRALSDEHAVCRRGRLQPCGRVDDITRGHPLARLGTGAQSDQRLAGIDGDSDPHVVFLTRPVTNRQRRAHSPFGIVLVRDRRAEQGHHRVADELLDRPPESLELRAQAGVVGPQQTAHVLGIHLLGLRREAHEVREQNPDDLPLLARGRCPLDERSPALRAEFRSRLILVAARRTDAHGRSVRRPATRW
jgi:hypothetical protein